jgi:endothelin-converting enzyme/putative endopeptidase
MPARPSVRALAALVLVATLPVVAHAAAPAAAAAPKPAAAASPAPAAATAPAVPAEKPLPALPYTPALDPKAMDKGADPCVDFFQYACGGWIKANPIPADRSRWSVYAKATADNQQFLWGMLVEASNPAATRTPDQQRIGDYFAACMDEKGADARGLGPVQPELDAIAALRSTAELPALLARLHGSAWGGVPFSLFSGQAFDDASQVIAQAGAGGLGLPDRDYYVADDDRSKEMRAHYVAHVTTMLELIGEPHEKAAADAQTVMAMETALATASFTRVERRNPQNLNHKMSFAELQAMTPTFQWDDYLGRRGVSPQVPVNVSQPKFYQALATLLTTRSLDDWKTYLRWHVVDEAAPFLSSKLVAEDFAFGGAYLQGVKQQPARWKRCVELVDRDLGEALGRVYVEKTFPPAAKAGADTMVREIQQEMRDRIQALDWMSPATKQQALTKLGGMRNKVGYPAHWRDYSSVKVVRDDLLADVRAARAFERARDLAKIGKPVDREEWDMSPPTVNAYYNPAMNDINFPAGVLQPPLYDARIDAAPSYGDTGSTVGHELTHGFDDEGSQFDASGNLRNWWTPEDRAAFEKRAQCVTDQYAGYVVVDDIHINSKLTEGEDLADLGGTILAYEAWKQHTASEKLQPADGLTPDQRFFVGFAQWACGETRPEALRLRARTDPHSPLAARVNGVVVNMPEFAQAFACKAGQPMVKPADKICKVW